MQFRIARRVQAAKVWPRARLSAPSQRIDRRHGACRNTARLFVRGSIGAPGARPSGARRPDSRGVAYQ